MKKNSYLFNYRVFLGSIGVLLFLILTGSFGYTAPTSTSKDLDKAAKTKIQKAYGKLPLYFIRNNGQVDGQIKYYEKGSGHSTFFTKEGVYLSLTSGQLSVVSSQKKDVVDSKSTQPHLSSIHREASPESIGKIKNLKSKMIKLFPVGANKDPEIVAEGQQAGKVNYFRGNDPEKWKTDIPTYRAVVYKEIYPGIDMKFYGNNREFEYDIIVSPGADPSTVRLSYEGIESLRVTDEGELEIGLKGGKILQKKPYIYQVIDGKKVEIKGKFVIRNRESFLVEDSKNTDTNNGHGQRSYGFELASYNKDHPIIIDPVLVYSTYLGGSHWDRGYGIAVDSSGNVYLTGNTRSTDFPTQNPIQPNHGGGAYDAFVTKINPAGDALVYSTYLGGSGDDTGQSIAVDGSGNVYLIGGTLSTNFPTQNPIQPIYGGSLWGGDAFVTKINPAGNALVYSTYLGGSDGDGGRGIAVDNSGNVYVIGMTYSTDFPTLNSLQPDNAGFSDAFVTKINPSGDALVYSTYLGGSDYDYGYGIALDNSGNVYLTGYTRSSDFPTQSPIQPGNAGFSDAFVTKINPLGDALVYSTYLGGGGYDNGLGIAVDNLENVYLTGGTSSSDFPTQNSIQPDIAGRGDAFSTKINPSGDALLYSTYLGGSDNDNGWDIAVDGSGNAYLTGLTYSSDFPTQSPIQPDNAGFSDAFVTKINPSGDRLVYSTYFGGGDYDNGYDIAVDDSGNAYLTGDTESSDFPTRSPIQPIHGGGGYYDAFITKISVGPPVPDIKANGSDGPLFITIDESVEATVSLDPGDMSGEISDWWIGVLAPCGSYWLDPSQNWVQSGVPVSVGQYPLTDLPTRSLFTTNLPPGYYIFFFILDDNPDGILDMTWHDYVVVGVSSEVLGLQTEALPDFESIFQEKIKELTAQ